MANGKITLGKQSGGTLGLVFPDGVSDTEVVLPESGELVNKDYADTRDAQNVKLTGNQTIAGVKTFTQQIISNSNITANGQITGSAVTQSSTDTTTGRLLKVGDFGVGAPAILPEGTDLNTFMTNGVYDLHNAINKPTGSVAWGYLRVIRHFSPNGHCYQAWTELNSANPRIYFRTRDAVTWTPWREIYHTGNFTASFAANDTRVKTALSASGEAPIYACRAWVNFNGTGTVAIRASGNVSSITDNGTGNYRVNFTTAMPDANYAPITGTSGDASPGDDRETSAWMTSTTSCTVIIGDGAQTNSFSDVTGVFLSIFR